MVQINKATVSDHEVVTELIMNFFVEIKHYAVAKNRRRLEVTAPSKKARTKIYKFGHQNRFVEIGRRLILHTGA